MYGSSLKPEDILINRVNTKELVGKAGIVEDNLGKVTFESKNIRVRLKRGICNPRFLAYFFTSFLYFRQIRSSVKAAIGQSTINQVDLNKIRVPLPEQEKIITILKSAGDMLDTSRTKRVMVLDLKKGLMQKLLTGKIRVKV